jgi:tRNA 5-methylaminomethyl-2-thiouridine biosynthesis bifunctional protein
MPKNSECPWFKPPPKNSNIKKVAIIGAGLAGSSCAYSLSNAGFYVDVFEKENSVASHASGNPLGLLKPSISVANNPADLYYTEGFLLARNLIKKLAKKNNLKHDFSGVLQVLYSQKLVNKYRKITSEFIDLISPNKASKLAGINIEHDCALFKGAGIVSPADLCRSMIFCHDKVKVNCGQEIKSIRYFDSKWELQSNSGEYYFDAVIIAVADKLNKFIQTKGFPIKPAAGQLSIFKATKELKNQKVPVCTDGYLLPGGDDTNVVGATYRAEGSNLNIRAEEHQLNLARLKLINKKFSSFDIKNIDGRVSIRATTEDHLPLVGPVANKEVFMSDYARVRHGDMRYNYPQAKYLPNLFMSVGHGSRGLSSSILASKIITDTLLSVECNEELHHLVHPSRFLLRKLKR